MAKKACQRAALLQLIVLLSLTIIMIVNLLFEFEKSPYYFIHLGALIVMLLHYLHSTYRLPRLEKCKNMDEIMKSTKRSGAISFVYYAATFFVFVVFNPLELFNVGLFEKVVLTIFFVSATFSFIGRFIAPKLSNLSPEAKEFTETLELKKK